MTNLLKIKQVAFLMDNVTPARAAATSSLAQPQVPWEIRQQLAQYRNISQSSYHTVYHIRRDLNAEAHKRATGDKAVSAQAYL